MTLIGLIVALVVIGVILYCVNTLLPIEASIKKIINIVVILAVLFWILQMFLVAGGPSPLNQRIG